MKKFDPKDYADNSDIIDIAYKYRGNVSLIAKHYNVSRECIYQFFKREDGKHILDKIRYDNTENMLDMAEHVIMNNLQNYRNDPRLAQRAAEKVLDGKGLCRGWHRSEPADISQTIDSFKSLMEKLHSLQSSSTIEDISAKNEENSATDTD